jgi:anaerobic magnesium-protoporphyrin IX monomethyl ester cyclase
MLHVSFVEQPSTKNFDPFRNQPLTSLYFLTILEREFEQELDLSLIDLRGIKQDHIRYHLPEKDVYFYTATSLEYHTICRIRDLIRSIYPDSLHIAGGVHFSIFAEENSDGFDSIVIGEGEEIIVHIIRDIFKNELKPVYRNRNALDLNDYPHPSRKYLPSPAVVDTGLLDGEHKTLRGTTVLFSRGCPFQCGFCSNIFHGAIRFRKPGLVETEIQYLKKEYNIEALAIKDDNSIPYQENIAKSLLETIGRTDVKWRGQSRANGVSEDIIRLASEAGCADVAIGIESASQKVLDIIDKKINLEEAKKYINTLKRFNIGVRIHFIFGLPGEPNDILDKTLDFINETAPESVLLSLFEPRPGSPIGDNLAKYGIKNVNENWHEYFGIYSRFDEKEEPKIMYEYEEVTPWGEGMSQERILSNYRNLQEILRERELIF